MAVNKAEEKKVTETAETVVETAPAEKKAPAKKTTKKTAETAVAEKAPAKRGRKPKTETTAKTEAPAKKTPAKKSPAKKTKKANTLSYETVFESAKSKIATADLSKISLPIATNIILHGECEGTFYVYINQGKAEVVAYTYDDYDVCVRADAVEFQNFLTGKAGIYDILSNGNVEIEGIAKKAVLFVDAIK